MNVVTDLAAQAAFGVAAATFTAVTGVGAAKKKKGEPPAGMVGKAAATLAGTVLSGGKGGNVRRWGGAGAGLLGGLRSKAGIAAALGLTNAAGVGTTLRSLPPAVKLLVCVGLDGAGFLLGDVADVAYAPLLAAALQGLFGDARVTAAGVAEETVPGRGNVPTATLAWCAERAGLLRKAEGAEREERGGVRRLQGEEAVQKGVVVGGWWMGGDYRCHLRHRGPLPPPLPSPTPALEPPHLVGTATASGGGEEIHQWQTPPPSRPAASALVTAQAPSRARNGKQEVAGTT